MRTGRLIKITRERFASSKALSKKRNSLRNFEEIISNLPEIFELEVIENTSVRGQTRKSLPGRIHGKFAALVRQFSAEQYPEILMERGLDVTTLNRWRYKAPFQAEVCDIDTVVDHRTPVRFGGVDTFENVAIVPEHVDHLRSYFMDIQLLGQYRRYALNLKYKDPHLIPLIPGGFKPRVTNKAATLAYIKEHLGLDITL